MRCRVDAARARPERVGVRASTARVVCTSSRHSSRKGDPAEVRDEVLVIAAQRGRPGPKTGGQPVLQPLPGGRQHPVWIGGMRWAQLGQGPVGLGAGTVTTSPQPTPRSTGSGGQLDREIPTPVPDPGQLRTVDPPSSSRIRIETSTAFVHTPANRHHYALSEQAPAICQQVTAAVRPNWSLATWHASSLGVGAGRGQS